MTIVSGQVFQATRSRMRIRITICTPERVGYIVERSFFEGVAPHYASVSRPLFDHLLATSLWREVTPMAG